MTETYGYLTGQSSIDPSRAENDNVPYRALTGRVLNKLSIMEIEDATFPFNMSFNHDIFQLDSTTGMGLVPPEVIGELDFSNNSLNNVQILNRFHHMTALRADNNVLTNVTFSLNSLQFLSLKGNKIETCPDLVECPNLKVCLLSYNVMAGDLNGLYQCKNLEVLDVSQNKFQWTHHEFSDVLKGLAKLNLREFTFLNNPLRAAQAMASALLTEILPRVATTPAGTTSPLPPAPQRPPPSPPTEEPTAPVVTPQSARSVDLYEVSSDSDDDEDSEGWGDPAEDQEEDQDEDQEEDQDEDQEEDQEEEDGAISDDEAEEVVSVASSTTAAVGKIGESLEAQGAWWKAKAETAANEAAFAKDMLIQSRKKLDKTSKSSKSAIVEHQQLAQKLKLENEQLLKENAKLKAENEEQKEDLERYREKVNELILEASNISADAQASVVKNVKKDMELEAAKTMKGNWEAERDALTAEIQNLKEVVASKNDEIDQLSSKLSTVGTELQQRSGEADQLREKNVEYDELMGRMQSMSDEIEALAAQRDQSAAECRKKMKQAETFKLKSEALATKLSSAEEVARGANEEIGYWKSQAEQWRDESEAMVSKNAVLEEIITLAWDKAEKRHRLTTSARAAQQTQVLQVPISSSVSPNQVNLAPEDIISSTNTILRRSPESSHTANFTTPLPPELLVPGPHATGSHHTYSDRHRKSQVIAATDLDKLVTRKKAHSTPVNRSAPQQPSTGGETMDESGNWLPPSYFEEAEQPQEEVGDKEGEGEGDKDTADGEDLSHLLASATVEDLTKEVLSAAEEGDIKRIEKAMARVFPTSRVDLANVRNDNGATPLHLAARNGHLAAAEYLLQMGADTSQKDSVGTTPLDVAEQKHNVGVTQLLYEAVLSPIASRAKVRAGVDASVVMAGSKGVGTAVAGNSNTPMRHDRSAASDESGSNGVSSDSGQQGVGEEVKPSSPGVPVHMAVLKNARSKVKHLSGTPQGYFSSGSNISMPSPLTMASNSRSNLAAEFTSPPISSAPLSVSAIRSSPSPNTPPSLMDLATTPIVTDEGEGAVMPIESVGVEIAKVVMGTPSPLQAVNNADEAIHRARSIIELARARRKAT